MININKDGIIKTLMLVCGFPHKSWTGFTKFGYRNCWSLRIETNHCTQWNVSCDWYGIMNCLN